MGYNWFSVFRRLV